MEENLFWVVTCRICDGVSLIDTIPDQGVCCPNCKNEGPRLTAVTADSFKDFMISTNAYLWQFFANKARSF